jgi:hypothetical protein
MKKAIRLPIRHTCLALPFGILIIGNTWKKLSLSAKKGVLAHEYGHFAYYKEIKKWRDWIAFAWRYFSDIKFRIWFERFADIHAMHRGHYRNLKTYLGELKKINPRHPRLTHPHYSNQFLL